MKNIFFICLCALFAFTGCADDDDDLLTGGNVDIDLLPDSKPNDVVNTNVFDIINLNYPGLEKVKEFYETGEYYYAANALLEYYRTRTNVTNPNLSLINVTISEADQAKADYALEDYRFHVNNFYEDQETLKPYSLKIRSPGAEAPQVSIVSVLPARPTYLPQPKLVPASIAKRFVTAAGRTSSL